MIWGGCGVGVAGKAEGIPEGGAGVPGIGVLLVGARGSLVGSRVGCQCMDWLLLGEEGGDGVRGPWVLKMLSAIADSVGSGCKSKKKRFL
jgi:hypothetical protein